MPEFDNLHGDLLHGASALAEFPYGESKVSHRIYKLVDKEKLPHFRLGSTICARKSTLLLWIAEQQYGSVKQSSVV